VFLPAGDGGGDVDTGAACIRTDQSLVSRPPSVYQDFGQYKEVRSLTCNYPVH
jgi:hypothetical protein